VTKNRPWGRVEKIDKETDMTRKGRLTIPQAPQRPFSKGIVRLASRGAGKGRGKTVDGTTLVWGAQSGGIIKYRRRLRCLWWGSCLPGVTGA